MLKTTRILKSTLETLNVLQNKVENFYLAGDTALAMYFEHRISVDLDFFSSISFNPDDYISRFNNISAKIRNIIIDTGTLEFHLEKTKVSFFEYQYPLIDSFSMYKELKVASLLDISCMKLTAIAARAEKKDYYDLYEILKHIPLKKIIEALSLKYGSQLDIYHILKAFTYFHDVENSPDPLESNTNWKTVKNGLLNYKNEFQKIIEK